MKSTVSLETAKKLREAGFPQRNKDILEFPAALDILDQMPGVTLFKMINGMWKCEWPITSFYSDERIHECPHEACAEAWMAWKKQRAWA